MNMKKTCNGCLEILDCETGFYKSRGSYMSKCKKCFGKLTSANQKARYVPVVKGFDKLDYKVQIDIRLMLGRKINKSKIARKHGLIYSTLYTWCRRGKVPPLYE